MKDESYEIHRTVSNFVLSYIPVKPDGASNLPLPLAFMTDRCRNSAEDDTKFTPIEKLVSKKILPWKKELDDQVRGSLSNFIRFNNNKIFPPIVLRARSGLGKSILVGKIIAELISTKFDENTYDLDDKSAWPKFDNILFSQLKDSEELDNLERAVCQGLDKYHSCYNFDQLFGKFDNKTDSKNIIFIDSLDEHNKKEDWWTVSEAFFQRGWRVVWTCRDPDWGHYKLSEVVDKEIEKKLNEQELELPWEEFSGKDWSLKLSEERLSELEIPNKKDLEEEDPEELGKIEEFVRYCYSETQLMHIFYTNFDLQDEVRENLDKSLLKLILDTRKHIINENKSITFKDLQHESWYSQFGNTVLTKLIIESSLEFLKDYLKFNVKDCWNSICKIYFEHYNIGREVAVLEEDVGTIDLDEDQKQLLLFLEEIGIMRSGNKFRHRDFATMAYINGSKYSSIPSNQDLKDDILFKFLFPMSVLDKTGNNYYPINEKLGSAVINDFIRRTGNIISQIKLVNSPEEFPTRNKIITLSRQQAGIFDVYNPSVTHAKAKEGPGLSPLQVRGLGLHQGRRAIVLKGFPGSGKTYSGVERILYRQSNLFSQNRTDSKALIVSLNEQLSINIAKEITSQHKDSPYIKQTSEIDKDRMLKTVHVKSLEKILGEWMPDLDKNLILSKEKLYDIFINLHENNKNLFKKEYRLYLEREFQNLMYSSESGKLLDKEEYLKIRTDSETKDFVSKHNINWKQVRELWYDRISRSNYTSIVEISTILRNRLIQYEFIKSKMPWSRWNEKYSINLNDKTPVERISQEQVSLYDEKFRKGEYEQIMIDEVQDLPSVVVIMFSFISPFREPNQFVISGDEFQTINGLNFDWTTYLNDISFKAKKIIFDHAHIYPETHHLRGLTWTDLEIEQIVEFHLTGNHRNHPYIVEYVKQVWKKWPENIDEDEDAIPLSEMTTEKEIQDDDESFRILEIETTTGDDLKQTFEEVLKFLNSRAKVSLLITNDWISQYVKNEFMNKEEDNDMKVEHFNAWTIKGLERDAVIILCPYSSSVKDPDTRNLYGRSGDNLDLNSPEVKLMRRKLLVSNTRAVQQMVIVHPPKNVTNLTGKHDDEIWNLSNPKIYTKGCRPIEFSEKGKISEELKMFFQDLAIDEKDYSIATISEGLDLIQRVKFDPSQGEQLEYFRARLGTVLSNDPYIDIPKKHNGELVLDEEDNPILEQERSKLRDILARTIEFNEIDLFTSSIIYDLIIYYIDGGERSFSASNRIEFADDEYSKMVKHGSSYSSNIPWSEKCFNELYNMINSLERIKKIFNKANFNPIYASQERENPSKSIKNIDYELENFRNSIENLIDDFGNSHNINYIPHPDSENNLIHYLFSEESKLEKFESKSMGNLELNENLTNLIAKSFNDVSFEIRSDNKMIMLSSKLNEIVIDREKFENFINIVSKLLDQKSGNSSELAKTNYNYLAVKLLELYHPLMRSYILSKDGSDMKEKQLFEQEKLAFYNSLKLLLSLRQGELVKRNHAAFKLYFENFHKDNTEEEYGGIFKLAAKFDSRFYELDEAVHNWKIAQFLEFNKGLRERGRDATDRANQMLINSKILDKQFQQSISSIWAKDLNMRNLKIGVRDFITNEREKIIKFKKNSANKKFNSIPVEEIIRYLLEFLNTEFTAFKDDSLSKNLVIPTWIEVLTIDSVWPVGEPKSFEQQLGIYHNRMTHKGWQKVFSYVSNHCLNLLNDLDIGKINWTNFGAEFLWKISVIKSLIDKEIEIKNPYQLLHNSIEKYPIMILTGFGGDNFLIANKNLEFGSNSIKNSEIVKTMLDDWKNQSKLAKLLHGMSDKEIMWSFEGFAEKRNLADWIKMNDGLIDFKEEMGVFTLIKTNSFNSRIDNYIKVLSCLMNIFENSTSTKLKLSATLQKLIAEVWFKPNYDKKQHVYDSGLNKPAPIEPEAWDQIIEQYGNSTGSPKFNKNEWFQVNLFPNEFNNNRLNIYFDGKSAWINPKKTYTINSKLVRDLMLLGLKVESTDYTEWCPRDENILSLEVILERLENIRAEISLSQFENELDFDDVGIFELQKLLPNELKKGDIGYLKNGWKFEIIDNKRGNSRMANVFGHFTEMGSILMTDVDYVIKDGKKYKLDVEKYLNEKSLRFKQNPIDFEDEVIEDWFDDDLPPPMNEEEDDLPPPMNADDELERNFGDVVEIPLEFDDDDDFDLPPPMNEEEDDLPPPMNAEEEFEQDLDDMPVDEEEMVEKAKSDLMLLVRNWKGISEEDWNNTPEGVQNILINEYLNKNS